MFALNLARVSETFEVHSWMLLLGILKQERCTASAVLQDLGVTDLYGAWHEVLWALTAADGLKAGAWKSEVTYCPRALSILHGAEDFASWAGREKTESQDLLMGLADAGVLSALFSDVDMGFDRVRMAVERRTKHAYSLPLDTEDKEEDSEGGVAAEAAAELLV